MIAVTAKHDDKGKLVAEVSRIIEVYREDVEECALWFESTGPVEQEVARHLPKRPRKQQKANLVKAVDKFDEEVAHGLDVNRQRIVTILRAKPRDPEPVPESGPASKPMPKQQASKPRKAKKRGADVLAPPALTQQEALLLQLVTSGPYGIGETNASKKLCWRSVKPTALRLQDAGYITRSKGELDFVLTATSQGLQWVRNNPELLSWTAI